MSLAGVSCDLCFLSLGGSLVTIDAGHETVRQPETIAMATRRAGLGFGKGYKSSEKLPALEHFYGSSPDNLESINHIAA